MNWPGSSLRNGRLGIRDGGVGGGLSLFSRKERKEPILAKLPLGSSYYPSSMSVKVFK